MVAKKLILPFLLMLLSFSQGWAAQSSIRDIRISVNLQKNGSAQIKEIWDVSVSEGTEWYLVRNNLGDIEIRDLSVRDANGRPFIYEDGWVVERSMEEKAGRCGMVRTRGGVEICWGIGSYGDHLFMISYTMTNAVKSLSDYDMLHMQFVSPELSARPEHVSVTISSDVLQFSQENSRVWGFGYEGTMLFSDGKVIAESSQPFDRRSSVIALMRFDKGFFDSSSIQNGNFESVLDRALEGSSFKDDDDMTLGEFFLIALFMVLMSAFAFMAIIASVRSERRKLIGVSREKDVQWSRNVPFDGDILKSYYIAKKLQDLGGMRSVKGNPFAAASILRMVEMGVLAVNTDAKGKIEISFSGGELPESLSSAEKELYAMMKEASGKDVILQDKEFSRWSAHHGKRISRWVDFIQTEALQRFGRDGLLETNGTLTQQARDKAREVPGFRKFLSDFTLVSERRTVEAALWRDYMVFASLFGIADKVAAELKDIDPKAFEAAMPMDPYTYGRLMRMSCDLANAITNADTAAKVAAASSGMGGHSSFGGGAGFSGGGFGGGAR